MRDTTNERGGDAPGGAERDWLASPCSSCDGSPCCTVVPIRRLTVETCTDLHQARALLSYQGVELGLYDSGTWLVYYRSTCRFLDPATGKCRVHGNARQPEICRAYSPHHCWYRDTYALGASRRFLRLNPPRFARIMTRVRFDEAGEISTVPAWEGMLADCAALPLGVDPADHPAECASPEAGDPAVCPAQELRAGLGSGHSIDACRVLRLPVRLPRKPLDLDLFAFQLGFPGVKLAVAHGSWSLLLQARCRWLGTASCVRATSLTAGRPEDRQVIRQALHLDLEAFTALRPAFAWDEERSVLGIPPVPRLRRLLSRIGRRDPEDRSRPRSA